MGLLALLSPGDPRFSDDDRLDGALLLHDAVKSLWCLRTALVKEQ